MNRCVKALLVVAVLAVAPRPSAATWVEFKAHDLSVSLDVAAHSATITDRAEVNLAPGWNAFLLAKEAEIHELAVGGMAPGQLTMAWSDSVQLPPESGPLPAMEFDKEAMLVLFRAEKTGAQRLDITFTARFFDPVEGVRFSNERVGEEVKGTILDQGAYLSPDCGFYPHGAEKAAHFRLTAVIPPAWESVADGNRLGSETHSDRKVQTWENPFESDGIYVMAAPYVTKSVRVDSIEVACYFFAEDTSLFDQYLNASADYIRMYSELIGPYPYRRFTVAENFFPTGYGMPAWTLLGQQVLSLPFIVSTSLGHEVLHNWWGNSVYVDYERGNWCEAATVYGADYRYKLLQSEDAARDYRKDILKEYLSYVSESDDFPIRQFKSRTSPETRTIGYNKGMYVYHMIHQAIGDKAFFDAWKLVYQKYRGKRISWEEWVDAFQTTSGRDLSFVIPQWIDRAGAPVLDLEMTGPEVTVMEVGDGYDLRIPVRFEGNGTKRDTVFAVSATRRRASLAIPAGMHTVHVDPDYDLFRKLYPEEVEPIISAVLGAPSNLYVGHSPDDVSSQHATQEFLTALAGNTVPLAASPDYRLVKPDTSMIVLNSLPLPPYLESRVKYDETLGEVVLQGQKYNLGDHVVVLASDCGQSGKCLVILSSDYQSLPRIGELVPHYGKYSYLVFEGTKNIVKGQWPVDSSPLRRSLTDQPGH